MKKEKSSDELGPANLHFPPIGRKKGEEGVKRSRILRTDLGQWQWWQRNIVMGTDGREKGGGKCRAQWVILPLGHGGKRRESIEVNETSKPED